MTVTLPMRTTVRTWANNQNSVSVDDGPLTFSLSIVERWSRLGGTDTWPSLEVYADSPWNYGLLLDPANPDVQVVRRSGPLAANPFTREGAPVELRATARTIPNWQADAEGVVRTLPATASASHCFSGDTVQALNDGRTPASSSDHSIPRMTWWDHKGTSEWVQYDYSSPLTASAVSVYWFDDTGVGECRTPQSWRLLYRDAAGTWVPVGGASGYGTALNTFNRVTFTPVTTTGLRVEVQLPPGVSGGILEWRVEGVTAPVAWQRIQNKNSLKVLGVDGMSTANSARAVQFDDSGTADYLWRLL